MTSPPALTSASKVLRRIFGASLGTGPEARVKNFRLLQLPAGPGEGAGSRDLDKEGLLSLPGRPLVAGLSRGPQPGRPGSQQMPGDLWSRPERVSGFAWSTAA